MLPAARDLAWGLRPALPKLDEDLSTREVEVLKLVARGLTNARVAEELYISPRTVNAHMGSVYHTDRFKHARGGHPFRLGERPPLTADTKAPAEGRVRKPLGHR